MKRTRFAFPRVLLILVLLTLGAQFSSAQLFPGCRIAGTVRNVQGAVVAGATVKLANMATGTKHSAVTNQNGEFNFPELALGTYRQTRFSNDGDSHHDLALELLVAAGNSSMTTNRMP